ncbi:MAG: pirin family protein [Spirochaetia bacterium]|nr:pirin family protein [Spirochaetia bacterium]
MNIRKIKNIYKSKPVIDGAGVQLKRAFGYYEKPLFDPFLLMDDFRSSDPEKYKNGFPFHPHRGIETITYILKGSVEHQDSMGNKGIISTGDVQWMTAGSGIVHQEMPQVNKSKKLEGFQIWVNLPSSHKMMAPRYQDIKAKDIPEIKINDGVKIKIICGSINQVKGPVENIIINPSFFDITIDSNIKYAHAAKIEDTVFIYVIKGEVHFSENGNSDYLYKDSLLKNETLVLFDKGENIIMHAGKKGARLLYLSGKPLREPIVWKGPIVMNTEDEIRTAFEEYNNGSFVK